MRYIIILVLLVFSIFAFGQKMDKFRISKKSNDTTWKTKSEYLYEKRKLLSGETNLSVHSYYKALPNNTMNIWVSGSFSARVIFNIKKDDKLEIIFSDGSLDSLYAREDVRSGVGAFGENSTMWDMIYVLKPENIANLTTKAISKMHLKAGIYSFSFILKDEKQEIIKNQLNLLLSKIPPAAKNKVTATR